MESIAHTHELGVCSWSLMIDDPLECAATVTAFHVRASESSSRQSRSPGERSVSAVRTPHQPIHHISNQFDWP